MLLLIFRLIRSTDTPRHYIIYHVIMDNIPYQPQYNQDNKVKSYCQKCQYSVVLLQIA